MVNQNEKNDPEFIEGPVIMKPWYVYIAESKTKRYYIGITQDVDKRIKRHNNKRGSKFAINQGPFSLVYKSRSFASKSDARKRELQIKGWARVKKEKLINKEWS